MIKYIIHAEVPFLQFEDHYLQPWIDTMQPTFIVKGRHTIHSDCFKKFEDLKKELHTELQSLDSRVCLTSDIWTASQNLGYMAITAQYVDAEFKIKKKIISFKVLEYPHSGFAIEEETMRCLTEWGLRCSAHILNILVQDGMTVIHTAIKKIRELLKHIDSSVSRLPMFNSLAKGMGLASKSGIYLDIPTRWNSTFQMLREALKYKAVLNSYAPKIF
ncbi:zinc finger BED domain-containing protein RICESLEEPER 2-like [Miscanthus floridulus]|uniref:zinc finger BED domain-containing protein RICESLEEPER 2-like n=1 Tax=Miscanthus floridulus TaxID=154761 RepID=UPI0034579B75